MRRLHKLAELLFKQQIFHCIGKWLPCATMTLKSLHASTVKVVKVLFYICTEGCISIKPVQFISLYHFELQGQTDEVNCAGYITMLSH